MRLLNTATYALQDFLDEDVPEYAVLSHRWTAGEATFQDYRKGRSRGTAGHQKIINACDFARTIRRQQWLWIDTCCIDKRSSAELSEAINSMFVWYKEATECYAYLEDVATLENQGLEKTLTDFAKSIWFKRGWTLQELVAPDRVLFCTVAWEVFGHKTSERASIQLPPGSLDCAEGPQSMDLVPAINGITSIPVRVLRLPDTYRDYSLAQRISWASDRKTGRIEDEAYCLLGLLDVHMPLLYGERRNAFLRLQQELLRNSTDESILAWGLSSTPETPLLADSPSLFINSHSIRTSDDLRVPRITPQSGLIRLDSGPLDECYKHQTPSGETDYLIRPRCTFYDDHENRALETPQSSDDERPCMLMLTYKPCGHYVRLELLRPVDFTSLSSANNWQKIRNVTFYIHTNSQHCYSGGVFTA